jgi:hypothetical protein
MLIPVSWLSPAWQDAKLAVTKKEHYIYGYPVPRNMEELSSELMCCVDLVDENVKVALWAMEWKTGRNSGIGGWDRDVRSGCCAQYGWITAVASGYLRDRAEDWSVETGSAVWSLAEPVTRRNWPHDFPWVGATVWSGWERTMNRPPLRELCHGTSCHSISFYNIYQ